MQEVLDFLKKCKTFYIATVEGDQPRVRPFGVAEIINGKLYIQTGKSKNVSKQMQINPKIEICAFEGPTTLRLSGVVHRDDTVETKKIFLDANPMLRNVGYDENDDNTEILYIDNATATFTSFGGEPKVINF